MEGVRCGDAGSGGDGSTNGGKGGSCRLSDEGSKTMDTSGVIDNALAKLWVGSNGVRGICGGVGRVAGLGGANTTLGCAGTTLIPNSDNVEVTDSSGVLMRVSITIDIDETGVVISTGGKKSFGVPVNELGIDPCAPRRSSEFMEPAWPYIASNVGSSVVGSPSARKYPSVAKNPSRSRRKA